ncbi:endonuclease VII domain-containing protein [Deinococcus carri]|uniref:endonuclease VII domain-containing protein n=1 Tax=Deinococcus carri TaxID=1211323 RepID=UPI003CD092FE
MSEHSTPVHVPEGHKLCRRCKVIKTAAEFPMDRGPYSKDGLYSYCKPCKVNYNKEYRARFGNTAERDRARRRKYGLTPEQFDGLWDIQGGRCLTCNRVITRERAGHAIDHCHSTGKVRGILCTQCNVALGMAQESPDILMALASYIREWQALHRG